MQDLIEKTYFVKINGKVNVPFVLAIGHNYKLEADCSVTQEQRDDNEAGGLDVTYKMVPLTATITKDNGEIVRAKDPRKNSIRIRNTLWKEYFNDTGGAADFDRVYNEATWVILSMMPQIYREAIKRLDNKLDNKND